MQEMFNLIGIIAGLVLVGLVYGVTSATLIYVGGVLEYRAKHGAPARVSRRQPHH